MRDLLLVQDRGFRKQIIETLSKENINQSDVEMLRHGSEEHAPFLVPIFNHLISVEGVPKHWCQLLKDVAKSSPAQGFAQCASSDLDDFFTNVEQFPERIYDGQLDKLGKLCPPLFNFVKSSDIADRVVIKPLVKKVVEILHVVEQQPSHNLPPLSQFPVPDTAGVFPHLPRIRERGFFHMDGKKFSDSCRKLSKGHKTLLPGIFLLHCEHGEY